MVTFALELTVSKADGTEDSELTAPTHQQAVWMIRTKTRALAACEQPDTDVWKWIESGFVDTVGEIAEHRTAHLAFELPGVGAHIEWRVHPVLPGIADQAAGHDEAQAKEESSALPVPAARPAGDVERAWTRPVPGRIVQQVQDGLNGAATVRRALDEAGNGDEGHYEVNMRPSFTVEADSLGEVFRRAAAWAEHDPRLIPTALGYSYVIDDVDGTDQTVHTLEVSFRYPGN